MRLVFMGTPAFSVPPLKTVHGDGHEIVAVYSQPPRPKNRGHEVMKSPVHTYAESLGLPIFTPLNFKDDRDIKIFQNHQADLAVVVAYGLILPKAILEAPRLGCLNIHASLLPRWRGAAPIQRAMLAGDPRTGITLMQMEEGLDTGPMFIKAEYELKDDMPFQKVHDDLSKLGADLLLRTLANIQKGTLIPEVQDDGEVTYAHKIQKEEGKLDFSKPFVELLRHVKTLNPWPGTYVFYEGQILKVHDISLVSKARPDLPVGTILDDACVVCGDGVLSLDVLQRPGGKPLSKADFLRGFPLVSGVGLF